jgi:hypothetical protein
VNVAESSDSKRLRGGRRPRTPEPVSEPVLELIELVQAGTKTGLNGPCLTASLVQRHVQRLVNNAIDAELEALAVWLLSGWDPNVDTDRIRGLMGASQFRTATNAIIAQMRRETIDEIRRHKRSDLDGFLETAVVE